MRRGGWTFATHASHGWVRLPHSRQSQVDAWNEGRHDGWLEAKRPDKEYAHLPLTMGHYTREDLPFYYALADAFTVCDQNYCSVMTSTSPNRCYFWTGTIRDEQHVDSKVYMRNEEIDKGGMSGRLFPSDCRKLESVGSLTRMTLRTLGWPAKRTHGSRISETTSWNASRPTMSRHIRDIFLPAKNEIEELSVHSAKLTSQLSAEGS